MKFSPKFLLLSFALVALVQLAQPAPMLFASPAPAANIQLGNNQALRAKAQQLFVLGNQARAAHGLNPLRWDPALASAALSHCVRMAAEGPISHRYADEPDVSERAGQAGAHFSLIEENVAVGPYPASIHRAWMNSPHHRENLLSPEVDRVGVAVVARGDVIYAVVDFERTVEVLSREQVETALQNLLQVSGVSVHPNPAGARLACALDHGLPDSLDGLRPEFIVRWQDADLSHLPAQLMDRIVTGKYKEAAVGSCAPQSADNAFTVYRVAVLLLKPGSSGSRTLVSSR
jgi:uncharacterized protein YkwD